MRQSEQAMAMILPQPDGAMFAIEDHRSSQQNHAKNSYFVTLPIL